MWQLSEDDVESIAIGAGILGTGGGGNPYLGKLHMQQVLRDGHSVQIVDFDALPDDALVCEVGVMGAPTVGIEKLPGGDEAIWALDALESYIGHRIDAIICSEIGGSNSIEPLVAGALTGKPVIDADGMGRAFPELQMSTHFLAGIAPAPAALVDEKGNRIIFGNITDPKALERFARDLCIAMGCRTMLALPVMTAKQARESAVRHTLTLARRVGDAVRAARQAKDSLAAAVLTVTGGVQLFEGKLVDVRRRTTGGFARGEFIAEGLGADRGLRLRVAFQNENLIAWRELPDHAEVLVTVPDLICTIESDTGEPITTEQLRYGLRVTILGIPCSDKWRTPRGLDVVGPAAFGYPDVVFQPLAKTEGLGIE